MNTLQGEGIIKGVSLIKRGPAVGHADKQGRQMMVDEKTIAQIFECANQLGTLKVRADHGSGVLSTIGYVENMRVEGEKILGDMHIYESEESRPKILEIAQKNPDHLGLSLEFGGEDEVDGEHVFARCNKLIAVALVSDPAANTSLFSAKPIPRVTLHEESKTINQKAVNTNMDIKNFESLSARIKALEDALSSNPPKAEVSQQISSSDAATAAPKATDPTAAPAVQNPNKDSTFEDPAKEAKPESKEDQHIDVVVGEHNPGEDNGEEDDDEEEDKKEDKKMKKVAEYAARMAIKAFSATLGTTKLSPAGVAHVEAPKSKSFSEILSEKTKEMNGDKNAAMLFCIKNFKSEYAASRLIARK